jgi:hypothetical protein
MFLFHASLCDFSCGLSSHCLARSPNLTRRQQIAIVSFEDNMELRPERPDCVLHFRHPMPLLRLPLNIDQVLLQLFPAGWTIDFSCSSFLVDSSESVRCSTDFSEWRIADARGAPPTNNPPTVSRYETISGRNEEDKSAFWHRRWRPEMKTVESLDCNL